MFEKVKNDQAFILLESILALSLVSFTMILVLPFSLQLLQARQKRQNEIEGYRLLYDYSYEWLGSSDQWVTRSGVDYRVSYQENALQVSLPNQDEIVLEVVEPWNGLRRKRLLPCLKP